MNGTKKTTKELFLVIPLEWPIKRLKAILARDKSKILRLKKFAGKKLWVEKIILPTGWELRRVDMGEAFRRFVKYEPGVGAGEATIGWTGVRAETVAKRWWAGQSLAFLEQDLGLDRGSVLVGCWHMATCGSRLWRKRWGKWAESVDIHLAQATWEKAPMPPTAKESG